MTRRTGFSEQDHRRAAAYLRRLADATSTGVYPASEISDLDRAIASIVDELHNEYSVGYYPTNVGQAGEQRRVEVRVNRPQLVVRARTGYVVDRSGAVVRTAKTQRAAEAFNSDPSLPVTRTTDQVTTASDGNWICRSTQPPINMVIVREGFVSHCPKTTRPNDQTNAWFIKKPGKSETMCKAFVVWNDREVAAAPLPEGYVVLGEVKSSACANSRDPGITTNAWEIRIPGASETVCKGFPLPRGYAMAGERSVSRCPSRNTDLNAWLIRSSLP